MATPNTTITTPIAQNQTNTCRVALPWFVQNTEYSPASCTYLPLVNGEEAFGAVYDAILAAKHSVDIICWGFQPSMYFRRGSGGTRTIGSLLVQKGKQNVKVRLLCWHDDYYLSQLGETNMPGENFETWFKAVIPDWVYKKVSLLARDYQTLSERVYDTVWYYCANLNNVTMAGMWETISRKWNWLTQYPLTFSNVEFATRDFPLMERSESVWRLYLHGKDTERDPRTKLTNASVTGFLTPSHHQKMVLIDYEDPKLATGFVMGHNMLDQYWDKSDHSATRHEPEQGRNGPYPWQDVSSRVTGPILEFLNKNFCQAWDLATGQSLGASRQGMAKSLIPRPDGGSGPKVMAQILRTQLQTGKDKSGKALANVADIEKMYLQAVNNATRYVFIQNQYFRFVPLANQIKQSVAQQIKCGRNVSRDGSVHLFVITNSIDDGVGPGSLNTYRMLDALGQKNAMPGVERAPKDAALDAQQSALEKKLASDLNQRTKLEGGQGPQLGSFDPMEAQSALSAFSQNEDALQKDQQDLEELQRRRTEISRKEIENVDVPSMSIPGLKVHVCTLVAPDSPAGNWLPVYVHAKVMTIDDAFTTQGSANLNSRSMENDSEMNICTDDAGVAHSLRVKLWNLHTKGQGAQDDPAVAFDRWSTIIKNNNDLLNVGKQSPMASLVGFLRTSATLSGVD
ncbi:phosphatidylserine/phosphatidylglycerophosphate/cardiolipin synthase family protein [Paraburkholderia sp. D15]|uniref:phospholipase D-like domain-containing protein n=1 Tax=Paraburkholderia sp. D15 TaxID=2880218 RepID=UPI0024794AA3|nr:phosphatidylserine/phosphatidylglycerophosphate/cardiolipin synthase family protein [Paraburkholderia sp. D15]WGS51345.1 phosphatidylserine/phosphatidylglycerophosphate/cardiolipin synthase family protein [Paraburkholderia sp. D15]